MVLLFFVNKKCEVIRMTQDRIVPWKKSQIDELRSDMHACISKLLDVEHLMAKRGLTIETHQDFPGSKCEIPGKGILYWYYEPKLIYEPLRYDREGQSVTVNFMPGGPAWLSLDFTPASGWTAAVHMSGPADPGEPQEPLPLLLELIDRFHIPGLNEPQGMDMVLQILKAKREGLPLEPTCVELSEPDAMLLLDAFANWFKP